MTVAATILGMAGRLGRRLARVAAGAASLLVDRLGPPRSEVPVLRPVPVRARAPRR